MTADVPTLCHAGAVPSHNKYIVEWLRARTPQWEHTYRVCITSSEVQHCVSVHELPHYGARPMGLRVDASGLPNEVQDTVSLKTEIIRGAVVFALHVDAFGTGNSTVCCARLDCVSD